MTRYSKNKRQQWLKARTYKNENKQTNYWTLLLGNKINNSTSCFFGNAETWFFFFTFLFFFEFFFLFDLIFFSFFFLFIHLAAAIQTESQWPPQTYSTEYGWSYNSKRKINKRLNNKWKILLPPSPNLFDRTWLYTRCAQISPLAPNNEIYQVSASNETGKSSMPYHIHAQMNDVSVESMHWVLPRKPIRDPFPVRLPQLILRPQLAFKW